MFKEIKSLDFGGPETVAALKSGAVQVGELFSTSVYDPDFQVLVDDKHLEAADNIAPVIRTEVDTPDVTTLLNGVSAKLTTDGMLSLNKMVDIDHQDVADVAKTFLNEQGLLGSPTTTGNGKTLTVGVSGAFSESKLVAEMYAQVLENAGYTVKRQLNLQDRKASDTALFSGQIDIKPEYLASEASAQDPNAAVSGDTQNNFQVLSGLLQSKNVTVADAVPGHRHERVRRDEVQRVQVRAGQRQRPGEAGLIATGSAPPPGPRRRGGCRAGRAGTTRWGRTRRTGCRRS